MCDTFRSHQEGSSYSTNARFNTHTHTHTSTYTLRVLCVFKTLLYINMRGLGMGSLVRLKTIAKSLIRCSQIKFDFILQKTQRRQGYGMVRLQDDMTVGWARPKLSSIRNTHTPSTPPLPPPLSRVAGSADSVTTEIPMRYTYIYIFRSFWIWGCGYHAARFVPVGI